MILTAKEFSEKTGTVYAEAANTLKFLAARGVIKDAGKRPQASGRGKPSNLFEIPEGEITLKLV